MYQKAVNFELGIFVLHNFKKKILLLDLLSLSGSKLHIFYDTLKKKRERRDLVWPRVFY